jgi:hypothetical protein
MVLPAASSEAGKKDDGGVTEPAAPPVAETKADAPPAEAAKGAENMGQANETKVDAPPAEAAKEAENLGQANATQEPSAANCDNKGQIQPGASAVRCT